MPSKSRKRNKGQERKAKKEAIKAQKTSANSMKLTANSMLLWRGLLMGNQCHHRGLSHDGIRSDHPVSHFMDDLFTSFLGKQSPHSMIMNLNDTYGTHQEVWNNEKYSKLAIDILVCLGTNLLLANDNNTGIALCIAHITVMIEQHGVLGATDFVSVYHNRTVASKIRDLDTIVNSRRDALKFYRKRVSCKCLKRLHLDARKFLPKSGQCFHCEKKVERVSLSVCSRCMVMQYCSRECQVANWPDHKGPCLSLRLA